MRARGNNASSELQRKAFERPDAVHTVLSDVHAVEPLNIGHLGSYFSQRYSSTVKFAFGTCVSASSEVPL